METHIAIDGHYLHVQSDTETTDLLLAALESVTGSLPSVDRRAPRYGRRVIRRPIAGQLDIEQAIAEAEAVA